MGIAILLSGGMDSTALAYWQRPEVALTIDYGQLAAQGEIQASKIICASLGIAHEVLRIDCRGLGSGDLVGRPPIPEAPVSEWWPYRNQLLVTLGAAFLLPKGVSKLLLGCVKTDSCHADGRSSFVEAMSGVLRLQEGGMVLEAPANELTSVELIKSSEIPIEVLAWAHSCHADSLACGHCRGCQKHFETTRALGYGPY